MDSLGFAPPFLPRAPIKHYAPKRAAHQAEKVPARSDHVFLSDARSVNAEPKHPTNGASTQACQPRRGWRQSAPTTPRANCCTLRRHKVSRQPNASRHRPASHARSCVRISKLKRGRSGTPPAGSRSSPSARPGPFDLLLHTRFQPRVRFALFKLGFATRRVMGPLTRRQGSAIPPSPPRPSIGFVAWVEAPAGDRWRASWPGWAARPMPSRGVGACRHGERHGALEPLMVLAGDGITTEPTEYECHSKPTLSGRLLATRAGAATSTPSEHMWSRKSKPPPKKPRRPQQQQRPWVLQQPLEEFRQQLLRGAGADVGGLGASERRGRIAHRQRIFPEIGGKHGDVKAQGPSALCQLNPG